MKKTILLSQEDALRYQEILESGGGESPDYARGTYQTFSIDFGKGIEVDIHIRDGDDTPYIDAILFDKGNEIMCLDPLDVLVGEYLFEYDDMEYVVEIGIKKPNSLNYFK